MASLMLMIVGSVSANGEIIVIIGGITSPEDGTYLGDEVLIEWKNGDFQDAILKYNPGACGNTGTTTLANHIDPDGEYLWDLSDLEDGGYCIKIIDGTETYYSISVIKDTIKPIINFIEAPYFEETSEEVTIKFDISDENGIEEWELDFGDENSIDGSEIIDVAYTYHDAGKYTITLTATDEAGNEATKTTFAVINGGEPDWVIPFFTGMNLFSVPLIPEDSSIDKVLPEEVSDNAEKIWSYQEGEWKWNTPSSSGWDYSTGTTKVTDIVPGYGYMLFMNDDAVTYGNRKELGAEQLPTGGIALGPGWNLIGHYGLAPKAVTTALASISFVDNYRWDSVLTLNEDRDEYVEVANSVEVDDDDKMESTKAYWVSVITSDGPIYL